ncbi:putative membrane protein [Rhodopseudomonas julia]|uniref:Membrane protein n=1 Tax=Rhodopseudomonas julia TaxID=200617 RepID=A0ABU0C534_9BRAD|nr:DUF2244 domain-containing protein [Rhodopseudomonas julia]MDQ0325283.1 putative membrane protein [Rhodopseudomonas julia]
MNESNAPVATSGDAEIFSVTLTPHRSLGPRGFVAVMAVFGATCFLSGLLFWRVGAWPIGAFFGLDFVILWGAFALSYRSGRAFEDVTVSRRDLLIRKVAPNGRARELRLDPYWSRLEVRELEDEGVVRLHLVSRGENVTIGEFLNPDDRASLADALRDALHAARRPPALAETMMEAG